MSQAQEARFTGIGPLHMPHLRRQPDEGRHRLLDRPLQLREHRSQAGIVVLLGLGVGVAAQADVRRMLVPRPDQRADDSELIHHLREPRHQLADLYSGHVGRDRLEFPANLGRRIRLEIEHVLVRRPSRQVDHDDRLMGRADTRSSLGRQDISQSEPTQGQTADLEELPPRNSITEPLLFTPYGQHRRNSFLTPRIDPSRSPPRRPPHPSTSAGARSCSIFQNARFNLPSHSMPSLGCGARSGISPKSLLRMLNCVRYFAWPSACLALHGRWTGPLLHPRVWERLVRLASRFSTSIPTSFLGRGSPRWASHA